MEVVKKKKVDVIVANVTDPDAFFRMLYDEFSSRTSVSLRVNKRDVDLKVLNDFSLPSCILGEAIDFELLVEGKTMVSFHDSIEDCFASLELEEFFRRLEMANVAKPSKEVLELSLWSTLFRKGSL
ncbi:MAG: hypothetical protein MUF31_17880 [Akkermansiaceae bacterium]|jgi:hypothetical protein|nr:hypothetical protein [Akkermansiaceae bacterium]